MAELRDFTESQLEEILNLCNENMEFDNFSETILREKVVDDPDYDPELVLSLWDNDKPVAFLSGVVRDIQSKRTGYIKLMVTHKNYQRQGLGKKLFLEIESRFRKRQVSGMRVYDVPFNYYMPGIDPRYTAALSFFETMGFKRFADTSNMIVDLGSQDFSTELAEKALAEKGVAITRAEYSDMSDVFLFVDEHFPLWRTEISNAYNSLPISLHIARQNGQLKAFSGHNSNNFGTGWFGPMGTHPDLRGMGIGGILLKRCLQDMKDWGLDTSVIPWVGPIRFYSYYANARVDRVFWRYEKIF